MVRFGVPVGQGSDVAPGDAQLFFAATPVTEVAFSPDGGLVVYGASRDSAGSRLYTQRLDQERADPIERTDDGRAPFFSPDGAWIGFVDASDESTATLKRVSAVDGSIETIAQLPTTSPPGLTWGDDGTIVVGDRASLYRVAATGGEWDVLAEADSSSGVRYGPPHLLPGSEVLLFHVMPSYDPALADIVALDLATRTQKTVLSNAMDPRYVQTGHLLFMREGTLMAVEFEERGDVQGQPVIMVEEVMHSLYAPNTLLETGAGQVAVSAAGHLAYVRGGVFPERPNMAVRITRSRDTVPLEMEKRDYIQFRVSPDGTRLAAVARHGQQQELWVHDLARGVARRLDTGGSANWPVAWSPDGRSLAFGSDRGGTLTDLYRLPADGSGEAVPLAPSDQGQARLVSSWSSGGVIAFLQEEDVWVLPADGTPTPFFASEASERDPTFSPDGQWLAYTSNESGRYEVYVRPYPGPEPATLISGAGGSIPAWSHDGRQLYFVEVRDDRRVMMAVDVAPGDPFQVGRAVPLIDPWTFSHIPVRGYEVLADGSFVIGVDDGAGGSVLAELGATELRVVLNWHEELLDRVPVD